jgi:hypothetical protein
MAYTLFEYLYRDADNFKAFGSVALEGTLSDQDLFQVHERFPGDGFFIAEQIGVPALYKELYQWSGGPTGADHCWHQFLDVKIIEDEKIPDDVRRFGAARAFLEKLRLVKGWQEELSPHFWLDL